MPRNWDERYAQDANLDFTPAPLLVEVAEMLVPGRALDIASGPGRNALYLAGLGWSVVAVDASGTAIGILRERTAAFAIEPAGYDLIYDFFYLQRNLFPQIREGVRPGGVFTAEIHLRRRAGRRRIPGGQRHDGLREKRRRTAAARGQLASCGRATADRIQRCTGDSVRGARDTALCRPKGDGV